MDFSIEREVTYRPDMYGNLDLPEEEQIEVTIEVPTSQQVSMLMRSTGGQMDTSGIMIGVGRLVKAVKNVSVNGRKIKDGKELVEAKGLFGLAQNIGGHILGMLTDVEPDPT